MGTRFALTTESSASDAFKERCLSLGEGETVLSLKKVSDNLSLDNYYENIDIESLMELTSGLEYCKM